MLETQLFLFSILRYLYYHFVFLVLHMYFPSPFPFPPAPFLIFPPFSFPLFLFPCPPFCFLFSSSPLLSFSLPFYPFSPHFFSSPIPSIFPPLLFPLLSHPHPSFFPSLPAPIPFNSSSSFLSLSALSLSCCLSFLSLPSHPLHFLFISLPFLCTLFQPFFLFCFPSPYNVLYAHILFPSSFFLSFFFISIFLNPFLLRFYNYRLCFFHFLQYLYLYSSRRKQSFVYTFLHSPQYRLCPLGLKMPLVKTP